MIDVDGEGGAVNLLFTTRQDQLHTWEVTRRESKKKKKFKGKKIKMLRESMCEGVQE